MLILKEEHSTKTKVQEKSWETPIRLQEADDQAPPPEVKERRRLNGKQPPPAFLKEMKLKRFEVEEDEAEVTRTILLHEVHKQIEDWKDSLKNELGSRSARGCLIPFKLEEAQEVAERTSAAVKVLPTKLVAVKKKETKRTNKVEVWDSCMWKL